MAGLFVAHIAAPTFGLTSAVLAWRAHRALLLSRPALLHVM